MNLRIKSSILTPIVNLLTDNFEEIAFTLKPDGLEILQRKGSYLVCRVRIEKIHFDSYTFEKEETYIVIAKDFCKKVKTFKKEIELSIDMGAYLVISDSNKKYKVPLLDEEPESIKLEKDTRGFLSRFKNPNEFSIDSKLMLDIIKESELVNGEDIEVQADGNTIKFITSGINSMYEKEIILSEVLLEKSTSVHIRDNLKKIINTKLTDEIKISCGHDRPIKIDYDDEVFDIICILSPIPKGE